MFMSSKSCLLDPAGELAAEGDTIEYLKGALEALPPGRYQVDETSAVALPSGRTSRRWGLLLKLDNGTIIEEPDPWEK
jgi:hypothetical protein